MKVWVRCARGLQVAYFTHHHPSCTLVSPSTWAMGCMRHPTPLANHMSRHKAHAGQQLLICGGAALCGFARVWGWCLFGAFAAGGEGCTGDGVVSRPPVCWCCCEAPSVGGGGGISAGGCDFGIGYGMLWLSVRGVVRGVGFGRAR